MLIDNHNRVINYVRLAVTDRCNLRCNYCMPEKGVEFLKNDKLLTLNELLTLTDILISQGVDKIRITGGEPFVRSDIMLLLRELAQKKELKQILITTNGTLIEQHIEELKALGIININLSMDAINEAVFNRITRRDNFKTVYSNLLKLIALDFNIKINFVVLREQNIEEILPILLLTRDHDISVRFLEEMPFNGGSKIFQEIEWNYKKILDYIAVYYPDYYPVESSKSSTSLNFRIPGHKGSFGVIPSFSRTFCGSCNRLRITASGDIITCLYALPSLNIREIIRKENSHEQVCLYIQQAVSKKARDGFESQRNMEKKVVKWNSMTSIGG